MINVYSDLLSLLEAKLSSKRFAIVRRNMKVANCLDTNSLSMYWINQISNARLRIEQQSDVDIALWSLSTTHPIDKWVATFERYVLPVVIELELPFEKSEVTYVDN